MLRTGKRPRVSWCAGELTEQNRERQKHDAVQSREVRAVNHGGLPEWHSNFRLARRSEPLKMHETAVCPFGFMSTYRHEFKTMGAWTPCSRIGTRIATSGFPGIRSLWFTLTATGSSSSSRLRVR